MRRHFVSGVLLLLILLLLGSPVVAAGLSKSENFLVLVGPIGSSEETQAFAEQVLEQAETYRTQIARELLGEELPPSVGKTIINVAFSDRHDRGRTWAIDSPAREFHNIYLNTTPERARSSTLAHEMTHVVLATRYPHPDRLPAWIEEGIASRYDDQKRLETRRQIVSWWSRTGNWPSVAQLTTFPSIGSDDKASYALAGITIDYLLDRAGMDTLLRFGTDGRDGGWDAALRKHYQLDGLPALQQAVEQHAGERRTAARTATAPTTNSMSQAIRAAKR